PKRLPKAPTGIEGFDQITGGGLPKGRCSLVCGATGCGKTLFGLEFLVHGAVSFGEPGIFVAFEESAEELIANVGSLGVDLPDLIEVQKIAIDHVRVDRREALEAGEYDLEGLFLRIGYAVEAIGAKRIVLDTIEVLFSAFSNEALLRAEIQRLFHWLKEKNLTAVITAERGQGALTRQGLEEYVSDCVILLDHRLENQVSTRRLRVVKYRGSAHGTNEYPFLIGESGFSVLPITALALDHPVSLERVSTGLLRLDSMLGGSGLFRGSSLLITGTAGAGKTSLAAHAADASVKRGERCLYFAFEESPAQIKRNMRSIGIDLEKGTESGMLRFRASRPTLHGLEMHLATMHREIVDFDPRLVIVDPVTNLTSSGSETEINAMLMRLIDFLKSRQVTALFTSLTSGAEAIEQTAVGISSLMDTWLLVRIIEEGGERNRGLYVLKSRGMPHSNQVREFVMTHRGVELLDVYVGPHGVLTGSARYAQEAKERAEELLRQQEFESRRRGLERRRAAVDAQIASLRTELESEEDELRRLLMQKDLRDTVIVTDRQAMAKLRRADEAEEHQNDTAVSEAAGKGAPQW
ncbi:MAG TPA: circadian clock protein KaiC, partial [Polyangiaceae bacterium]|nr:circadian clock protein KaiC [Polyangiaceae bacterium]